MKCERRRFNSTRVSRGWICISSDPPTPGAYLDQSTRFRKSCGERNELQRRLVLPPVERWYQCTEQNLTGKWIRQSTCVPIWTTMLDTYMPIWTTKIDTCVPIWTTMFVTDVMMALIFLRRTTLPKCHMTTPRHVITGQGPYILAPYYHHLCQVMNLWCKF